MAPFRCIICGGLRPPSTLVDFRPEHPGVGVCYACRDTTDEKVVKERWTTLPKRTGSTPWSQIRRDINQRKPSSDA
jgi:hypothetical protein